MIVLIGGVSGSGKSTVGVIMAERLNWRFADGDSFHPAANIAKMRSGQALTDADRQPWLTTIEGWMDDRIAAGESAVIPCSLLKRRYRAELTAGRPEVKIAFLGGPAGLLRARLTARHGHFFSAALLDSQLAVLELPGPDEDVLLLPAVEPAPVLASRIVANLGLSASPPGRGAE
jgi:gluconokinase